ncbi:hypothetical protein T440DRAFT_477754 [Plenodomus tracheiphilus IPT5]|uniref:Amine oxidase domain-containing protein n=1 Tax=Plenodomus tracheiphilus IPT5 TaxID=1408161 RepID=A0A6A7B9S3_9PLEO|nr:hypothetical protein T440DRAFT_477754 [Plenodomus tracheiphilus IPT5]
MLSNILSFGLLASTVTALPALDPKKHDPSRWSPNDVIYKDVAIVGGGSSGTYSAIALKDKNISCIVIEIKDKLGGHTETYTDPATGAPVDYGVVIFHVADIVKKYFGRFNIPLTTINPAAAARAFYDFRTGKQIVPAKVYSQEEVSAGLAKYAQLLSQWPELTGGLFVPDPVPAVLTQPLGEVAKQYGFEAALSIIANFNPGLGDQLTVPFLEVTRVVNLDLVQTLQSGFLQTVARNNSLLYTAAAAELAAANSLLLSSHVADAKRSDSGVTLIVKTPLGEKLIVAKTLLITIPVKVENLKPFALSKQESTVFGKFMNGAYYTSILKNAGLPPNVTFVNNGQNNPSNFASLPAVVNAGISGPNLYNVYYEGPRTRKSNPYSDDFVKKDIIASLKALQKGSPNVFPTTEPEFVRFSSHNPFYLQVCGDEIKNGFYKSFYALQGLNSTFYTGASWKGQDSTGIWKYTERVVIPQILVRVGAVQVLSCCDGLIRHSCQLLQLESIPHGQFTRRITCTPTPYEIPSLKLNNQYTIANAYPPLLTYPYPAPLHQPIDCPLQTQYNYPKHSNPHPYIKNHRINTTTQPKAPPTGPPPSQAAAIHTRVTYVYAVVIVYPYNLCMLKAV